MTEQAYVLRTRPANYTLGTIQPGLYYKDAAYEDSNGDLEQCDEFVEKLACATLYETEQQAQDALDDLCAPLEVVPLTLTIN